MLLLFYILVGKKNIEMQSAQFNVFFLVVKRASVVFYKQFYCSLHLNNCLDMN